MYIDVSAQIKNPGTNFFFFAEVELDIWAVADRRATPRGQATLQGLKCIL